MSSTPLLSPFLETLHQTGRLRVWSIVVTIFGDLVQPRGIPISTQELLQLTTAVGIEGNAVRTALSRLAKEGWVERHKQGRTSAYSLSQSGSDTFLTASERIYNRHFYSPVDTWDLAIHESNIDPSLINLSTSFLISRTTVLSQSGHLVDDVFQLTAPIKTLPPWMRERLLPDELTNHYQAFHTLIDAIETDDLARLKPLDAMALRFVLIHFWRRLVLRHPLLPQCLEKDAPIGAAVHNRLRDIYKVLVPISEQWWDVPTSADGQLLLAARF